MKKLTAIKRSNGSHWVGDGFPVRNIFSYTDIAAQVSPFLMLDYAGPAQFPPTDSRKGVGEHPHRGFETVTIVYDGEVEHRDSGGGGGKVGPGDVQWMTAASGVVHEEFHGTEYARRGGPFEMIQLWVNLPRKDKMDKPRYQEILDAQIPRVELERGAGAVRVIAGRLGDAKGPALTYTPMNVWDVKLNPGARAEVKLTPGHTATVLVMKGGLKVSGGDSEKVTPAELAIFERDGDTLLLESPEGATVMVLSGEPIDEPIVGYGPFVMNTEAEIRQAIVDFQSGRMGRLG